MRTKLFLSFLLVFIVLAFAGTVSAQTAAFTYQGRLTDGVTAANGTYEMQFALFDVQTGDVPAAGDYDGDGNADATVFRPSNSTWFANRSTAGVLIQQFGITGDLPVPNAFVP